MGLVIEKPILKTKHGNIHISIFTHIIKYAGMSRKEYVINKRNVYLCHKLPKSLFYS